MCTVRKGFTLVRSAFLVRSAKVNTLGFTLVELLITITIIVILSAIALVSYTSFIKSSRDAKRQSDLKFIQSALEQFHADQKSYPAAITFGGPMTSLDGKKTYLTVIPNDPQKDIKNYAYTSDPAGCDNTNCTSYCLYARLENTILPNSPGCSPTGSYTYSLSKP